MSRSVPVWLVLLLLLCIAILIVPMLTAARYTAGDADRLGLPGRIIHDVAGFPVMAKQVFEELMFQASDAPDDRFIRAARDDVLDFTGLQPVQTAPGIDLPNLMVRASARGAQPGWRFLSGAFFLNGAPRNAVLLMAPDNRVVHYWRTEEVALGDWTPRPENLKVPHGLEVIPDGSILVTHDPFSSLQRLGPCGQRLWATAGDFHHTVTLGPEGDAVWAYDNADIIEIDLQDGTILRRINTDDIMAANPGRDVFEMRRQHETHLGENRRDTTGRWMSDALHFNDIDPLPAARAAAFEGFDAGDLMLSARSLNAVIVVDSDTLELKWWRHGAVQRQHDPDWLPNGEILVYNNRMSRDYSEIVSINPQTFERTVVLDGRDYNFYSRIRGKQQVLDNGNMIVTSSQQGRVFEVAAQSDGAIVHELFNFGPDGPDGQNFTYVVTEAKWFPPDTFDMEIFECTQ
jgi:hypothetical protein